MQRFLIKFITFLGGIYFFLEFMLPEKIGSFEFGAFHEQISKGLTAVVQMAVGLGLINLLYVHGSRIAFRRSGSINSVALLLGLVAMLTVTLGDWRATARIAARRAEFSMLAEFSSVIKTDAEQQKRSVDETRGRVLLLLERGNSMSEAVFSSVISPPAPDSTEAAARLRFDNEVRQLSEAIAELVTRGLALSQSAREGLSLDLLASYGAQLQVVGPLAQTVEMMRYEGSSTKQSYRLLYEGLFISLGSAMFALLGFYMASAAYQAFRIRSLESGLMMAAALVVMLGQMPFGLWIWDGFGEVRLWLLSVPSTAAFRAIKLGAAIAGLVMALRMWLSIESDSFGGRE